MSITTTVQITIAIDGGGNFGDNWKMADIKRVAVREAEDKLRKIISCSPKTLTIIGKPKVINFIHSEDL